MDPQDEPESADRSALERLALADWSSAADARIESVVLMNRFAAVNLYVNGDYEYSVIFQRDEGDHWEESGSSSGHMDASDLSRIDPASP